MRESLPTPPEAGRPKHGPKSLLIIAIKVILTLVIVYFVGKQVAVNWDDMRAFHWHINWWLLTLSVGIHLVAFAFFSQVWCYLMKGFGYDVPFRHGFKIAYIANLGRYIPGRIWPIFGMLYVARQMKLSEAAAMASWGMTQLFGTPSSFVVGIATVMLYPHMLDGSLRSYFGVGTYVVGAGTIIVSLLLTFLPNLCLTFANYVLQLFKRPRIEFKITVRQAMAIFLGYMIGWVIYGLAFWVFVHALIDQPGLPVFAGIGAFLIAYQIGYLAIFTPAGLGARELVMIGLLTPYIGPVAAGLAVAARVWNTISDIIASAIALRLKI